MQKIPNELMQAIYAYLIARPMQEVEPLVVGMRNAATEQQRAEDEERAGDD